MNKFWKEKQKLDRYLRLIRSDYDEDVWNEIQQYCWQLFSKNEITKEEAQAADFVIIASDQKIVGMDRFEGKKVIRVDINICIKAPEAVLKKCVAAVSK